MGAPRQPAHGVLMAVEQRHGSAGGVPDIEGAQYAIHAGGCDHGVVVLVPVVSEDLGRRGGGEGLAVGQEGAASRGGVDGYHSREVVLSRDGGAEVEDPEVAVRGGGGDDGRVAGREGGAVGAAAYGEGL